MSKFRGDIQELALEFMSSVDESRVADGLAAEQCREARIVVSIWKYLGFQDASHKRRMTGKEVGP